MKALQNILERCGLDAPDGRPLHRYLVTDKEHARLGAFLGMIPGGFRDPSARIAQAFVLWAAEHIRRNYPGNILSWEFVFDALNLPYERALALDLTEQGLTQWGRSLRHGNSGRREFLYSLLAEGGLPDQALADAARYRDMLLALIRRIEAEGALAAHMSKALEEQAIAGLPQVLQSKEQAWLVMELAQILVELRRSLPEDLPHNGITGWLDAQHPGWRDRLPLRLSPRSLEALILPALEQERSTPGQHEPLVSRELRLAEDQHSWLGIARIGEGALLPWDALPAADRQLRLRLIAEDGSSFLAVPGDNGWRLARSGSRGTLELLLAPDQPAVLTAYADGLAMGEVMLDSGQPQPADAPSLWRAKDLTTAEPHVLIPLSGRGRTRATRAFLLTAQTATLDAGPGIVIGEPAPGPGGQVWPLSGSGRIRVDGSELSLTTEADDDAPETHLLVLGRTLSGLTLIGGGLVHLGEAGILGAEGEAWPQRLGHGLVRRALPAVLGGEIVEWRDDGVVLARARIVSLPEKASFKVQESGPERIRMTASGLMPGWLLRLSAGPVETTGQVGRDSTVSFELTCATPQAWFGIRIVDPATGAALELQGIWPARRPRLVAPAGTIMVTNTPISHASLTGWRGLIPEGAGAIQLRIGSGTPVAFPARGVERLAAHSDLIAQALSLGGADGRLNLRLVASGHETDRLEIGWYDWEPEAAGPFYHLGPGETLLHAVLLADPLRTETTSASGRIDMAGWLGSNDAGLWFIQGKSEERGIMRPFAWQFSRMQPTTRDSRLTGYANEWRRLLAHPDDSGWTTTWQQILALRAAGAAVALDQVQALGRVPAAAITLILRAPRKERAAALALESEIQSWLPLVQVADWATAIQAQKSYLGNALRKAGQPEAEVNELVGQMLGRIAGEIATLRPELIGHLGLAMTAAGQHPMALRPGGAPMPLAVPNPEPALHALAQEAARRFARLPDGTGSQRAQRLTLQFNLNEELLPLLHAPLVVAEVAMGWRPYPRPQEILQLLALRFADPAWFDTALPAAMSLALERSR